MQPQLAADILVKGMKDGIFTGVSLSDYITNGNTLQYIQASAILAGAGGAQHVADMALKYFNTLTKLSYF
ncbi:hypothetical protein V2H45_24545 [Tumidithrix elongata RA019]|uniref:Uncharacterized protein n=1 Tax=Tumidithrix elongata BACA0141 TaxID=2716417 RepID=A0AAW9Q6V5_9CYAN|nr:hypothetical protein [Tumidithrix elongata RA019]